MSSTQERILDTARRLFNEQGLHRVGVRDIARALEISPGNLAYHFATKDVLVAALVRQLHQVNARTAFADLPADFSLPALYTMAVVAMRNMLDYRFALLSYVTAAQSSAELLATEAELAANRRRRAEEVMRRLCEGGHIERLPARRLSLLHEQGRIVSSAWLADAVVTGALRDDRGIVLHYAKVGIALLEPHATERGARDMRNILAGRLDARVWPEAERAPGSCGEPAR